MLGDALFAWRSLQGRAEAGGREGVACWRGWGVRAVLRSGARPELGQSCRGLPVGSSHLVTSLLDVRCGVWDHPGLRRWLHRMGAELRERRAEQWLGPWCG